MDGYKCELQSHYQNVIPGFTRSSSGFPELIAFIIKQKPQQLPDLFCTITPHAYLHFLKSVIQVRSRHNL